MSFYNSNYEKEENDPFLISNVFCSSLFIEADKITEDNCDHLQHIFIENNLYCTNCGANVKVTNDNVINKDSSVQYCDHINTITNDAGITVCTNCAEEINSIDFTQEWRWFSNSDNKTSKDPSRCHKTRNKPKGVQSAFDKKNIVVSPGIINIVQQKYDIILENLVNKKLLRGGSRNSIISACLFHAYKEVNQERTAKYVQNILGISQKSMSSGMKEYYNAFPEDRCNHTTPIHLIPWVMTRTKVPMIHFRRIKIISEYLMKASSLIERSTPQSVAAATVFFYLTIFPNIKDELSITKSKFAEKAGLSDVTMSKLVVNMNQISTEAAIEWGGKLKYDLYKSFWIISCISGEKISEVCGIIKLFLVKLYVGGIYGFLSTTLY